jgi:hypothetical protein
MATPAAPARTIGTLTETLSFTPEDLAANRAGNLSEAQKERLTRNWRRTLGIVIGLVIVCGLGATILLFVAQQHGSPILSAVGVLVTFVNAAIVGLGAQSYLRTSRDIREGRVTELSGVVSHTIRVSGRAATYILNVGGQPLVVTKPVFFAVEDGKPYRFYRTPMSKTLLSGEQAVSP